MVAKIYHGSVDLSAEFQVSSYTSEGMIKFTRKDIYMFLV